MARRPFLAVVVLLVATSCDGPELVDVGGHRLETLVLGEGRPAVVFEGGFIGGVNNWRPLQDSIARITTTVSYERAGLGESDLGPEPRNARQLASELRALLTALRIDGPVILVGHSAGGMFARVFAAANPELIAGLVLVDPATEGVYDHMRIVDSARWAGYEAEAAGWPAPLGWYAQWRALPESIEQARVAWPLPPVPIVVLTATQPIPGEWPVDTEEHMELWAETHADLADRLGDVQHLVLRSADHMSILGEPAVLETIVQMVRTARLR